MFLGYTLGFNIWTVISIAEVALIIAYLIYCRRADKKRQKAEQERQRRLSLL